MNIDKQNKLNQIEYFRNMDLNEYCYNFYCKADNIVFDNANRIVSFAKSDELKFLELSPSLRGTMMLENIFDWPMVTIDIGKKDFSYAILFSTHETIEGMHSISDDESIVHLYNDLKISLQKQEGIYKNFSDEH